MSMFFSAKKSFNCYSVLKQPVAGSDIAAKGMFKEPVILPMRMGISSILGSFTSALNLGGGLVSIIYQSFDPLYNSPAIEWILETSEVSLDESWTS